MRGLERAGGVAGIFLALAYVVGFAAMATLLDPGNTSGWRAADRLGFAVGHRAIYQPWMALIYVAAGTALVPLAAALNARLQPAGPQAMAVATPLGCIWAGLVLASGMVGIVGLETVVALQAREPDVAAAVWIAVGVVQEGLGGGIEFVGGAWMLLLGWVAWQAGRVWRVPGALGMALGAAGVLTVWPALKDLVAVFGLGQIVWFGWVGLLLIRAAPAPRS